MADDEGPETTPGYKISKKVDMGTILEMDNEDESLRKYKEALLGKAALSGAVARTHTHKPPLHCFLSCPTPLLLFGGGGGGSVPPLSFFLGFTSPPALFTYVYRWSPRWMLTFVLLPLHHSLGRPSSRRYHAHEDHL
jgi:hypothetical protein